MAVPPCDGAYTALDTIVRVFVAWRLHAASQRIGQLRDLLLKAVLQNVRSERDIINSFGGPLSFNVAAGDVYALVLLRQRLRRDSR